MRKKLIIGNWKMNKDVHETVTFVNDIIARMNDFKLLIDNNRIGIVICPPFVSLFVANEIIKGTQIKLGAQNVYHLDEGAYTGEISLKMLKSVGCEYVILGHSERRQYFQETNDLINLKVKQTLINNLIPIICVGETLSERELGVTDRVITTQINAILSGLNEKDIEKIVIAYEPVWAIGTGKNASPEQANQVHIHIRNVISTLFTLEVAEKLIILYGGSVNVQNANELLSQSDIDGFLVGGASIKGESFINIIRTAIEVVNNYKKM